MNNFSLHFFDKKILILVAFLVAQLLFAGGAHKDLVAQAGSAPEKKDETPMAKQDGNVIIDPAGVANSLKIANLKNLKKLKSSFYNLGQKDKYDTLLKAYVDATITLSERKFTDARRKFEQNQTDINEGSKALLEKYKEKYTKMYADFSYTVVDLKINSKGDTNASYEKYLAAANDLQSIALELAEKGSYSEAVYSYRNAILNLVRIPYYINKNKHRNLKVAEKISKNLLIEDDYVPKENLSDYDDSRELIYEEREKEREREREQIKKGITSRLGGEVKPEAIPDPKKDPQGDKKD